MSQVANDLQRKMLQALAEPFYLAADQKVFLDTGPRPLPPVGQIPATQGTMVAPNGRAVFYLYRPKMGTDQVHAFLCPPCDAIIVLQAWLIDEMIERAIEAHETAHGIR